MSTSLLVLNESKIWWEIITITISKLEYKNMNPKLIKKSNRGIIQSGSKGEIEDKVQG